MSVDQDQEQQSDSRARRELSQLMRLHERLMGELQDVLTELEAPTTVEILRKLRNSTSAAPDEAFAGITASVEEAIRALQVFESEVKRELLSDDETVSLEGLPDLPPVLARFLAERSQEPGFSYELDQDEVRGWIIRWKEYTDEGTIRGYGHVYERPHAWLGQ